GIALFVDKPDQIDEAVIRLARVGHETVVGTIIIDDFEGGKKWVGQVSVEELNELTQTAKNLQIVDVRRPAEYAGGHVPRAVNLSLNNLYRDLGNHDPSESLYVKY